MDQCSDYELLKTLVLRRLRRGHTYLRSRKRVGRGSDHQVQAKYTVHANKRWGRAHSDVEIRAYECRGC